jgi:hypothetical protein
MDTVGVRFVTSKQKRSQMNVAGKESNAHVEWEKQPKITG